MNMHDPFWDLFTVRVDDEGATFAFQNVELHGRWICVLQDYTGYPHQFLLGGLLLERGVFVLRLSKEGLSCLKQAARECPKALLGDRWRLHERFEHAFNECYHGRHPQGPKTIWERISA